MHVVDSLGIDWPSETAFQQRVQHEAAGTQQILRNQRQITSFQQLQAYLFLGGHQELHKYLLNEYKQSSGSGW
jgi:hypothetical protein